jgi:uncharacterized RDD family membrane protein YckC
MRRVTRDRILDTLVGAAVGFFGGFVSSVLLVVLQQSGAVDAQWVHRLGHLSAVSLLMGAIGPVVYHAASEGIGGASIGKAALGLRVCRPDGSTCSAAGAVVRNLAYYVDAMFFGAIAYGAMSKSPLQQRLGDRWGRTAVVRAASLPARAPAGRVALGIGVGVALWSLEAFASTLLKAFGF